MFDLSFKECESCRAKPGSPQLCESCLHNRAVISHLKSTHTNISAAMQPEKNCTCKSLARPDMHCPRHGR